MTGKIADSCVAALCVSHHTPWTRATESSTLLIAALCPDRAQPRHIPQLSPIPQTPSHTPVEDGNDIFGLSRSGSIRMGRRSYCTVLPALEPVSHSAGNRAVCRMLIEMIYAGSILGCTG